MPYKDLFSHTIVLNSASPRRRQLLESMGFKIVVCKTETDESYPRELKMEDIPLFLSKKKGLSYDKPLKEREILLCSDTMVFLHGEPLGKPQDHDSAYKMLKELSNNEHKVISACYLRTANKEASFYEQTSVTFKPLSEEAIEYYIDTYKPYDKAGAYGIQEWIGMTGIAKIEGDYYNVMGLPTVSLFENLLKITRP